MTRILQYIVQDLQDAIPLHPSTLTCFFKEPITCIETASADFPSALRDSLARLKASTHKLSGISDLGHSARARGLLAREAIMWTLNLLEIDALDQDVIKVLRAITRKTWNQLLVDLEISLGIDENDYSHLLERVQRRRLENLVASGTAVGLRIWPRNPRILAIQNAMESERETV